MHDLDVTPVVLLSLHELVDAVRHRLHSGKKLTLINVVVFQCNRADLEFHIGHPSILPSRYFGRLDVLAGGRGAGTRIRFEMKAFGGTNIGTADITEPVPGRELRETLSDGIVTTFLVEPVDANSARVTISTSYLKDGLRGLLETLVAPPFLRRVYSAELAQLAEVARGRQHLA